MLKIKVSIYLSATTSIIIHTTVNRIGHVRSQGGVVQGKKHFAAYMRTLFIHSQEAAHKIIVRLFHPLPFESRSNSRIRGPHLRRVSSSKKGANESW
jgi:hypothetical protein